MVTKFTSAGDETPATQIQLMEQLIDRLDKIIKSRIAIPLLASLDAEAITVPVTTAQFGSGGGRASNISGWNDKYRYCYIAAGGPITISERNISQPAGVQFSAGQSFPINKDLTIVPSTNSVVILSVQPFTSGLALLTSGIYAGYGLSLSIMTDAAGHPYGAQSSGAPAVATGIWRLIWKAGTGATTLSLNGIVVQGVTLVAGEYTIFSFPCVYGTSYTITDNGAPAGSYVSGSVQPA